MLTRLSPIAAFCFLCKERKAERKDGILVFDWMFDSRSMRCWLQLNASRLVEPGTTSSSEETE